MPPSAPSSGYVVDWKVKVSEDLDRMYGENVPAPFLSVYIDDCIGERNGLLPRRRPVQHRLHPVRGVGNRDGQPLVDTDPCPGGEDSVPAGASHRPSGTTGTGTRPCDSRIRNKTPCSATTIDRADAPGRPRPGYPHRDHRGSEILARRDLLCGPALHHLPRLLRPQDGGHPGRTAGARLPNPTARARPTDPTGTAPPR
ncbi:MAG: hypothetical protein MZU95_08835 [Desulfomicrobium escambiense]|nr:hypothetical protein [Desulfomicrobium escambiense]